MSDHGDLRSGRYRPTLAAGLVAALLALGGLYHLGTAGSQPGTGARLGMDGYVDPQTGEFTAPPAGAAADLDARAVERPATLVERPGLTPGGGVLLDGAPMVGMTATVGAGGHVSARCGQ